MNRFPSRYGAGILVLFTILLFQGTAIAEPNLQMFTFDIDKLQIGAGQDLTVTYVVRNDGTSESPATTMRVYYSFDQTIATNDTVLADINIDALGPGVMTPTAQITVMIPVDATPGSHWVGAIVDPDRLVTDSNRNDNSSTESFNITEPADLKISMDPITSETPYPGGTIQVTYTVINAGQSTVTNFITRLYYSDDQVISTEDTAIDYEGIASIGSMLSLAPVVAQVSLPLSAVAGKRYIGAIADPDNTIMETNDDNNTQLVPINVTALTCFEVDSHSPDVCSGRGTCVAPDNCECFENWGGEQCDTPILADDNIADEGTRPDVHVVEDTTSPDIGQPDAGFDNATPDQGSVVDTAVSETTADATPVEDDSDADGGGCGQSGPAPMAPVLFVIFAAFAAMARRRTT